MAAEKQRVEVVEARARAAELELLVSEQQETLDRLISDAMGEVARREKEWLQVRARKDGGVLRVSKEAEVRARKDGRIAELEAEVSSLHVSTAKAEKRAAEFGGQLHEMEEALLREIDEERELHELEEALLREIEEEREGRKEDALRAKRNELRLIADFK
ncbi:hypothetical protein T484DRAFT_1802543 [Baffinella frigidus]|nr:hypothetical protein T484DRAFT_1802543 [Cryptophyta sp. CCMP2293]